MGPKSRVTRVNTVAIGGCMALTLLTLGVVGEAGRRLALEQACLSNVEVLTQAWLTYADDHNGELVRAYPAPSFGWVRQAKTSVAEPTLEDKLEAIKKGSLFSYVGDLNVYHCPADSRLNDPKQLAFCSFSIAGGANGPYGDGYKYVAATRYADIDSLSTKYIFVEESDPRGENLGAWEMSFNPLCWVDPLAMWHEEATTLGFADGHGDVHGWHDQSVLDYGYQAIHGVAGAQGADALFPFKMTPPPGQTRDIEFMRDGFPCKARAD